MAEKIRDYFTDILIGGDDPQFFGSDWFLAMGRDLDQFSNGDYINLHVKGGEATVVRNPAFPLTDSEPTDIAEKIQMNSYAVLPFRFPFDKVSRLSYDQQQVYVETQKRTLRNQIAADGIWMSSPYADTADTPIVKTTSGSVLSDGYKGITKEDIIALRKRLDTRYPGLKNAPWVLIMDLTAYWNLIETDSILQQQQGYMNAVGTIGVKALNYYGFEIYADNRTPYYDGTTNFRMLLGATPVLGTDLPSATAFVKNRSFGRAMGNIEMFDQRRNPYYQADIVSFQVFAYCGCLSQNAQANLYEMGAICRTK